MDEENSTQQAYGDLITATLFVFIITLVAYIINFTANQQQEQSVTQEISDLTARKSEIVLRVSRMLNRVGVDHQTDLRAGIIRLTANSLSFDTASFTVPFNQETKLERTGKVLAGIVPCYVSEIPKNIQSLMRCAPEQRGQLDGIIIEGHTDNVPFKATSFIRDNLDLSAKRAATIHSAFMSNSILSQLENKNRQPIFSIAGYGEMRPINTHVVATNDPENRRIDLRFILRGKHIHGF